jgi:hypothetical protein
MLVWSQPVRQGSKLNDHSWSKELNPYNTLETTPKKRILAFLYTEGLQEIVKRQDGSMSYGICNHQLH